MKQLAKVIFISATIIGFILISILLYVDSFGPQYSGKLETNNIRNKTEIFFDDFGIPHIYAQNEYDLFFTLGYTHAMERLFQMEMVRRLSSGRLAEILGEDLVDSDKFYRLIGIDEKARINAEKLKNKKHTAYYQAAKAYVDGINSFISTGNKPIEFRLLGIDPEPFTFVDIYRTVGYMAYTFATGFTTDPLMTEIYEQWGEEYIKDLAISYVPGTIRIPIHRHEGSIQAGKITSFISKINKEQSLPTMQGSNGWVLGPDRTESGSVILCNDPHIVYSQPAIWYESHLKCPKVWIYGYHMPGIPFPMVARTNYSAWGLTMFLNDDVDFFREKINPANANQYVSVDGFENIKIRKEIIKVKDQEDIQFLVRETGHGPVITDIIDTLRIRGNNPVSVWWAYYQLENNELESLYNLLKSTSIDQSRHAISRIYAPGLNFMYGDIDNNIAWWAAAKLPIRPDHVHPFLFSDGSTGKDDYLGFYDFSTNPQSENPPGGLVYSANNQPDSIAGKLYPGYYCPGDRASRINYLLSQKDKWNAENLKDIILDNTSSEHVKTINKLISYIGQSSKDTNDLSEYIDLLMDWDGNHSVQSIQPTIYYKWLYYLLEMTFGDEIGMERVLTLYNQTFVFKRALPLIIENSESIWWDDVNTLDVIENREDIIANSLRKSIKELSREWGDDCSTWTWGKAHRLEHVHPVGMKKPFNYLFNVGPFEVNGGNEVINNLTFSLENKKIYKVIFGPSIRRIENLDKSQKSYTILPTGQSGHFMSPYYDDQAILYNEGSFRLQQYDKEYIIDNASSTIILIPLK